MFGFESQIYNSLCELGKFPNVSKPQFLHLYMRIIIPGFASISEAWVIDLRVTFLEPLFYVSKAHARNAMCNFIKSTQKP